MRQLSMVWHIRNFCGAHENVVTVIDEWDIHSPSETMKCVMHVLCGGHPSVATGNIYADSSYYKKLCAKYEELRQGGLFRVDIGPRAVACNFNFFLGHP